MICDFVSSYIDTWCKNLNEAGNYNFNYISPTRGGGGGGGAMEGRLAEKKFLQHKRCTRSSP